MALTDSYATAEDYRAFIASDKQADSDVDDQIEDGLAAISRYIDDLLGRPAGFNRDDSLTDRTFFPRHSSQTLYIDDFVEVSSVAVDDQSNGTFARTLTTNDYEVWPLNAALNPQPRPYTKLRATPWGLWPIFCAGQRVRVTAYWGWPAVPEAIRQATLQFAGILRIESPRATSRVQELNTYVGSSQDGKEIIHNIMAGFANVRGLAR